MTCGSYAAFLTQWRLASKIGQTDLGINDRTIVLAIIVLRRWRDSIVIVRVNCRIELFNLGIRDSTTILTFPAGCICWALQEPLLSSPKQRWRRPQSATRLRIPYRRVPLNLIAIPKYRLSAHRVLPLSFSLPLSFFLPLDALFFSKGTCGSSLVWQTICK